MLFSRSFKAVASNGYSAIDKRLRNEGDRWGWGKQFLKVNSQDVEHTASGIVSATVTAMHAVGGEVDWGRAVITL